VRTPSIRTVDPWLVGPLAALLILSALPATTSDPGLGVSELSELPRGAARSSFGVARPESVPDRGASSPSWTGRPTGALDPIHGAVANRPIASEAPPGTGALVATIVSAPARVDVGVSVRLSGTASGGTGPYDPFWSLGIGNITPGWTIDWSAPSTVRSVVALFEVRDRVGAYASASVTIEVAAPPFLEVGDAGGLGDVGVPFVFPANVSGGSGPFTIVWSVVNGSSSGSTVVPSDGTYALAVVPALPGPVWVLTTVVDAWNRSFDGLTPVGQAAPAPTLTAADVPFAEVGYPTPLSLVVAGGTPPFSWAVRGVPGVTAESRPTGR
jgi:hypothetical protein